MPLDAAFRKLSGANGRLFADPQPSSDETSFQVDNTGGQHQLGLLLKPCGVRKLSRPGLRTPHPLGE